MASPFDIDVSKRVKNELTRGNIATQAELYHLFAKPIYILALRFVADNGVAEDIVHDVFIKAFQKIGSFKGDSKLGFWIRKIAINESLDRLRRQPKNTDQFDEMDFENVDEPFLSISLIEAKYDLSILLDTIKPIYRSVLWLHEIEGLKHTEIAKLYGKSTSFSKMALSRAMLDLKTLVEKEIVGENYAS